MQAVGQDGLYGGSVPLAAFLGGNAFSVQLLSNAEHRDARETRQYWVAPCGRWHCPACGQMLARRWRSVLQWATEHGEPPQYLLTLTLRDVLPLWRQVEPARQAEQRAQATGLCQMLTRALTRLVAGIRQNFGHFEYVAFVELTTGRPARPRTTFLPDPDAA